MTARSTSAALLCLASLLAAGCGDDDGEPDGSAGASGASGASGATTGGTPSTSGASSGGSSAGNSTGGGTAGSSAAGSATSGTPSGGSSSGSGGGGTAGSGGVSAGHCAPGDLLAESAIWNQKLTQCPSYDEAGVEPDANLSVRQLNLPNAMTAGEDYALSIDVAFAAAGKQIELYGTSGNCAAAEQKLYEGPMTKGMLCATLQPTASYPSVLLVWRGEGNGRVSDITACAAGTCP